MGRVAVFLVGCVVPGGLIGLLWSPPEPELPAASRSGPAVSLVPAADPLRYR